MNLHDHLSPEQVSRLGRLPQWAGALVRRLLNTIEQHETEAQELRNEVARLHSAQTGNLDVTTIANPHSDLPYPIGDNPLVRHVLADGGQMNVEFTYDGVEVSNTSGTNSGLSVEPVVSNCVKVVRRAG
jgi:hypothetical protein